MRGRERGRVHDGERKEDLGVADCGKVEKAEEEAMVAVDAGRRWIPFESV